MVPVNLRKSENSLSEGREWTVCPHEGLPGAEGISTLITHVN